jgi:hypothetical protein
MNKKMLALKNELKAKAVQIRAQKAAFKDKQRTGSSTASDHYSLDRAREDYRIKHIIYSLARGNTYEEIERTTTERKLLSQTYLETLQEKAQELRQEEKNNEETICDRGPVAVEITTGCSSGTCCRGVLSEVHGLAERSASIA